MRITVPLSGLGSAAALFDPEALAQAAGFPAHTTQKLVDLRISDFLQLAAKTKPDEFKLGRTAAVLESDAKFNQIPKLDLKVSGPVAKVVSHEGRHRAMLLSRLGYQTMPVIIDLGISLWAQTDPKDRDYLPKWPSDLIGENGTRLSFPFPRSSAVRPTWRIE